MPIDRRRFLLSAGDSTAVALGGVYGVDRLRSDSKPLPTDRYSPAVERNASAFDGETWPMESEDDPAVSLGVGDRSDVAVPDNNPPVVLRIENGGPARDLVIDVFDTAAGQVLDRTVSVAVDATVAVELREPDEYLVAVGAAPATQYAVRVESGDFSCGHTRKQVKVDENGTVFKQADISEDWIVDCL